MAGAKKPPRAATVPPPEREVPGLDATLEHAEAVLADPEATDADVIAALAAVDEFKHPGASAAIRRTAERRSPLHQPGAAEDAKDDVGDDEALKIADASRAAYKGAAEVVLYRVASGEAAEALAAKLEAGAPSIRLEFSGTARFLDDLNEARSAAEQALFESGVVVGLRVKLPTSAVVASHRAVPEMDEGEVWVVLNEPIEVAAADVVVRRRAPEQKP